MARLLEWQNLVFVLALLVASVLVLGAALGLVSADAEADVDVDAEADADGDLDGEHELPAAALTLLGVGRAPLSLLVITMLVAFGATGICLNLLLEPWPGSALARGVLAVLGAGATSVLVAGAAARVFARWSARCARPPPARAWNN